VSDVSSVRERGLLLPGLFVLGALTVLIGLGIWQLERLAWKEALIVTLERRVNAPPIPLPPPQAWPKLTQDTSEFQRVSVTAEYLDRPAAHVFTGGSALRPDIKAPGYFVFAPARLPTGEIVVVNAGYVPDRGSAQLKGKAEIVGYLRWPEARSWFVSDHDASGSTWHVRDHRLMARRLGWGDTIAPFYIDQESQVPPGGVPRPGPLTVKLRNDHLGYAITWFGLAAVLLVVFGFWLVSRAQRSTQ
jgi:cytochrome oxidase assembly protein ShyY1